MAWDLPGLISAATDRTAAYFNKYKASFDALAQHNHAGTDGSGAGLALPPYREIHSMVPWFPEAAGDFTTYTVTGTLLGYITNGGAALNDEGEWKFWCRKTSASETARIRIRYLRDTNAGIAELYFNGVNIDSTDMYNGSALLGSDTSNSFTIASDGYHTIKIVMASKNASSSAYACKLQLIGITYT